jgi:hypothetical protein
LKKEEAIEEDESRKAKLQQRIHNAEVDVNYATYYPLMKVYSSLYPKSKNTKSDQHDEEGEKAGSDKIDEVDGPKGNMDMWRAVERAMEDDTLNALRNSKDAIPAQPPKKSKATKDKEAQKRKTIQKRANATDESLSKDRPSQDGEDESDDGFFE